MSQRSRGENFWKSDQKVVTDDKFNQKIVMDEKLVQDGVMNEKLREDLRDGCQN